MNKLSFHKISSWDDFKQKLTTLNNKKKGDYFELLTKLYFQINPIYDFYDEVWMLSDVPQKELEYLELPSHDLGIDLIAKSGKEYHAIQCKYHSDKNQSVTFKEVSTFISLLESNDKISQGYICSSAFVTSRNFNKLKTKPINLLMSDTWQLLDEDFFKQANKLLKGKRTKLVPFKPHKHQQLALKEAIKHFNTNKESRGKLIFPCGAGKSLTGFWMTQELESKSTIVAVPSLSLVKQTLEVYLREIVAKGNTVKWLCICSDEGIGKNDDVAIFTENLGVPCQTNPSYIEQWLKENIDEEKIIFTTYQSGRIIAEISKKLNLSFDVGIFDEAHKTVGSDKKLFSHLLFDENISIDKRIFMTATERFYAGSRDDIISMDDENIYGETFAQMSFKEAIEAELLTDYKVITIDIKKSEISKFIKENNLVQLNDKWKKETEARSLASMLALRKAMKKFNIKNAVSFHSSIEKAVRNKELQQHITDTYGYQPIDTYTVSGKIPTTRRNDIVQEFAKSPKSLITNARCLTEGVDVPNIDCIVFADPRKSRVDIVQALGRALRKKKGKEWGYVVLPIIYNDETQEIDNDSFNEILSVIRGLASNDERIIAYLKDKSDDITSRNDSNRGQFGLEVFSDYISENELAKELQIKLWDKLAKYNWMPFSKAREFTHQLFLESKEDWTKYKKSGKIPSDIPSNPNLTYKDDGWLSWEDWLGKRKGFDGEYMPFKEAIIFIHSLNLKSQKDWKEYCKSDDFLYNMPKTPQKVYKNDGWLSWADWLGKRKGFDGEYMPFKEARVIAQKLNIKTKKDWKEYCKSDDFPYNMPLIPSDFYKDDGWLSWADWLGTKVGFDGEYMPYEEAKAYVHKLKLKNKDEWIKYYKSSKRPHTIPSNPYKTYKDDGWVGYGDWLGTGNVRFKKYRPFLEAKEYVNRLGIKTQREWKKYVKSGRMPNDIPSNPNLSYKNKGWIGYGDWLGTGKKANRYKGEYRSFESARAYARKQKFKNIAKWKKYCKSGKKPLDIPSDPSGPYKNKGWNGYGDWLDTGNVKPGKINYKSYKESLDFARNLNFKSQKEWEAYLKTGRKPIDIPSRPNMKYKDEGWQGYAEWFGVAKIEFKSYKKAKTFVNKLNLKNIKEWLDYCKSGNKPNDIPSNPNVTYKDKGWISYGDWLGTGKISKKRTQNINNNYMSFIEAKTYVHKLNLTSQKQWIEYCKTGKKPCVIPNWPYSTYKNKGWVSFGDWLGTENISNRKKKYRDFSEARTFVNKLKLENQKEWREYCKSGNKPDDIPSNPHGSYKNSGWSGYGDWLGTKRISNEDREFQNFSRARDFVHSLKLQNTIEWKAYCKSGNKPSNIPSNPNQIYKSEGWKGYKDWLGTGFKSIEEAKKLVQKLEIRGQKEWFKYCKSGKKPKSIPSSPDRVYRGKGWNGWGDFFDK
jgi:superfamily II DNA or RNA helicase